MTTYTIFSDYHLGHPYALKPDFTFDRNTVFLGDNFDLKNTLFSELEMMIKFQKETIKKCKKEDGIYLHGNHSLKPIHYDTRLFEIRKDIFFTHGDIIDWSDYRAKFYRNFFSAGKNQLMWNFVGLWKEYFSKDTIEFKDTDARRAVDLAKLYNCKTLVMGHFHPKDGVKDITQEDVRIVIVPRGKTIIEL